MRALALAVFCLGFLSVPAFAGQGARAKVAPVKSPSKGKASAGSAHKSSKPKVTQKLSNALKRTGRYIKNDAILTQAERTRKGMIFGHTDGRPRQAMATAIHMLKNGKLGPRHRRAAIRTVAKSYAELLKQSRRDGTVGYVRRELRRYERRGRPVSKLDRDVYITMLKESLPPMQKVLQGKVLLDGLDKGSVRRLRADSRVTKAHGKLIGKIAETKALINSLSSPAPTLVD